ncbi:MAG: endolytic transglycosylase MltG [Arenicellales bacterium]|nr:endolytic transglycosylase MltG [Arenicellales bacterium]
MPQHGRLGSIRGLVIRIGSILLVGALIGFGYWLWSAHQPVNSSERFTIDPGEGVSTVARKLVDENIISEPYSFVLWSYQRGYTRSLKAGEYRIEPRTTLIRLLDKFFRGDVISYSITFVEGWTFREYLTELAGHTKLRQTVQGKPDIDIMSELGYTDLHPEGRFFPDTYRFTAGMSDIDILRKAFDQMESTLDHEWENRDKNNQLKSREEALILASIIEKETGKPEERGMISGVFHNRLKINMRLQTDPTVIYGLGDKFSGNLKRSHLKQDTPYNTYTRYGLPPTPIANPGAEAIRAALNPAETKALYFVARGDGSHKFSETLAEHNTAVAQFQLGRNKTPTHSNSNNE